MKILLISDFFPTGKDLRFSGGVEARAFFIAKNLATKNVVHVITSMQQGAKEEEKMFGFMVHRIGQVTSYVTGNITPFYLPKKINFANKAIKKAIDLDIDIVDGCDFFGHFIAKIVSIKKRVPVVFWYPDVFIGQWIKTSGIIAGMAGYLLEKINLVLCADYFIAISNQTKNKLIQNKIDENKIAVVSCGVDLKEFKFKSKNGNKTVILTIGRLVWYKRIKDLMLAFALLNTKIRNLNLEIIGRGPELNKLKSLSNALKIGNKVNIRQNLTRKSLVEAIKSAAVFCLPSEVEGFGITVIEAAAAGVPYVISDIAVFKEVTGNGKGGLLFKLGSISDLSNKLETLINDQDLYSRKRQEGLLLAKNYSWEKISRQTEDIYKKLIAK